jgi:hypothetical protein
MSPRSSHHSVSAPPPPGCAGSTVPPRCAVADFPPVFAGRGRGTPRLRRVLHSRRRLLAAGLAVAATGATVTAARVAPSGAAAHPAASPSTAARRSAAEARGRSGRTVSAPVRIADPAVVELLRPGDRVDVIAAAGSPGGSGPGEAKVLARGALVERVPESAPARDAGHRPEPGLGPADSRAGALIVLRVSRSTATELAGSSAASPLAVTLR